MSGRISVFLLTFWPAEMMVGVTGNPWAGIISYGLLFYIAPLAGLVATYAADRSPGRLVFLYACVSTTLLCPLIFGFPTEMWLAHALFWPTLALSHYARPTLHWNALVFAMWLLLAFTHEGALVLLAAILVTLAARDSRSCAFMRAGISFAIILMLAVAAKISLPPDEYYTGAFIRAAMHFFDPAIFKVEVIVLLLAAIAGYLVLARSISVWFPQSACIYALAIVLGSLAIYWLRFDQSVHASSRYHLRTALVVITPLLGVTAALAAMAREGIAFGLLTKLQQRLITPSAATKCAIISILIAATLVHVVEIGKFVAAWSQYREAVARLAMRSESHPALGDTRFVSSKRISPALAPLEWFSTTPYLSIILADFRPNRMVIDPDGNYFWLSCATATRNADAHLVVPRQTRDLVREYSCLHR
jgi:hypothetical protein